MVLVVSEVSVSGEQVSGMRVASSLGWPMLLFVLVLFFFFLFGTVGTRPVMTQSCHAPPSYISARTGWVERVAGVRVTSRSPNPLSCKSWESGDDGADGVECVVGDDDRERVVITVVGRY